MIETRNNADDGCTTKVYDTQTRQKCEKATGAIAAKRAETKNAADDSSNNQGVSDRSRRATAFKIFLGSS